MAKKNIPHRSIKKRIELMVYLLVVMATLLTCGISIYTMVLITNTGTEALETQLETKINEVVEDSAYIIDLKLDKYEDYIKRFSSYIEDLYDNADSGNYVKKEVLPPDPFTPDNVYTMQRYTISSDIDIASIKDELELLGNLESVWAPMMEIDGTANADKSGVITTVYVGTASGFIISYDANANILTQDDFDPATGESYWDFRNSNWYLQGKESTEVFFTDIYADSYGRGLCFTCASPFYNKGEFAGVIAIDILVSDIQKSISSISFGEGSYACLADMYGDIFASPYVKTDYSDWESPDFENITTDEDCFAHVAWTKIRNKETGTVTNNNGSYVAYTPITNANWFLIINIPADIVEAPVQEMSESVKYAMFTFAVAFLIVTCVAIAITGVFANNITEPIIHLKETIINNNSFNDTPTYLDGIRNDDFPYEKDEVGELADAFKNMASTIKDDIAQKKADDAEKQRIKTELDVATQIQSSMLPSIFPAFPDRTEFDIYATMNPAKEVGGDFYDFFMVDDKHLAVVMADVSGKGVPAALFMVIGKTLIKDHTNSKKALSDVFTKVNNLLCESNSENLFITAFEGVLDLETGEFNYVNAGHNPPMVKSNGKFEFMKIRPGFVLAAMEDMKYKMGSITLQTGDELYLYTDGVVEATNAENELYGDARLSELLNNNTFETSEEVCKKVKEDVDLFVGDAPQFDDITMLSLKFKGVTKLEKTVEATISNIPLITDFVNAELEKFDCSPKAQMQIDIAIDELFSNIARYAYNPEVGPATVRVEVGGDPLSVIITFIDKGIPYDPLAKKDPDITLSADQRQIGGLGIFMVKKTMDEINYEYKDGQNILTIKKKI